MWSSFAACAMLFAGYVYFLYEPDPAFYNSPENLNAQATTQYLTGYLLETALAFDNIFVICHDLRAVRDPAGLSAQGPVLGHHRRDRFPRDLHRGGARRS